MGRAGAAPKPVVVVVGLGPAGPELTTPAAAVALSQAPAVLLRTARHPASEPWVAAGATALDHHYEAGRSFAEVYAGIVEEVVASASCHGRAAYAVPGSPYVLESSVAALRADDRVAIEVVPGMSFLDLAWARLGVDPVAERVRLVDAQSFAADAAGDTGPLLVAHLWSKALCSEVKLSVEAFPEAPVTVLHHLGLPDEAVLELPWSELDRGFEPDHLTCCYVPELGSPVAAELVALDEVVRELRQRCPWDAEQTHVSLARHLLEEACEAIEAIDELGPEPSLAGPAEAAHLEEELGDVLGQVVLHGVLAAEEGLFDLADVARGVRDKLVRRHPHVYAAAEGAGGDGRRPAPATAGAQEESWERQKQREKGRASLTEGVPLALPALAAAAKLEGRARSAGLALEATGRLLLEVADAPPSGGARPDAGLVPFLEARGVFDRDGLAEHAEERLGAVLLELARLAAGRRLEPEQALRRALRRWQEQIHSAERSASEAGRQLTELPAGEALTHWRAAGAG